MMRIHVLIVLAGLAGCPVGAWKLDGAQASAGERQFLDQARQLTFEGKRSGEGYFSADGKALIFQSEREPGNPFFQMYILDLETGDSKRVSPGTGKTTCGFFRPGTVEVLFASTHLDPKAEVKQQEEMAFRASGQQRRYAWDYDEEMDIFTANRDGSGLKRLTDARGYDAEGAYSPDGKRIVFCSLRHAYSGAELSAEDRKRLEADPSFFGEIYTMDADGSNVRRLTFEAGYDGGPFFSPDGQRIIWRRFDDRGNADVYTMKVDGSETRRLTDFGCMAWAPVFHPSGEYVIFTANKLGFSNFELYVVDAKGEREPVRVTHTDGFDGLPVFSPDGKRICWTSNRTGEERSQLFLANWDDGAARLALANSPARARSVAPGPALLAAGGGDAVVADSPEIQVSDLKRFVSYLASDELAGRRTGEAGAGKAAEYLAGKLREAGVRSFGEAGIYFQPFEFNAGVRLAERGNGMSIVSGDQASTLEVDQDFRPLSFTDNGSVEGQVVFAGYGLSVPGKAGEGYDSYAGLNVSNKIVLVLRYVPENVSAERKQVFNRYAALRHKAMIARNYGARGILIVSGPNSPGAGSLVRLSAESTFAGSGVLAASVGLKAAEQLFAAAGKKLQEVQTGLDNEDPHAAGGFEIPNVSMKLSLSVDRVKGKDRNVIGVAPAGRSNGSSQVDRYVLLGAHYDHLGLGDASSLGGKEGEIHNGADDNASGVAAVLELAGALAREPSSVGVIFAFWSGEEIGLIGSSHFAEHPPVPLTNVIAYLNFDMVGRLRENKLQLQGLGSSSVWRRMIERRNVAAGFDLVLQDDPFLPTDVTALYPKGIPVLSFFTGSHEQYHKPEDDTETLNYEGLERITRFARVLVNDLAAAPERPDYVKVEGGQKGGARDNLRVYLGTVPDYASDGKGLKLSGVRAGSPAEKAGLKGGDVIIEFAGQKVADVYDYMYALDAANIGRPVGIVVRRDGKEVRLEVTPAERK